MFYLDEDKHLCCVFCGHYTYKKTVLKYTKRGQMLMEVTCEFCGHVQRINGIGRKPIGIPLEKVIEAVEKAGDVKTAAELLSTPDQSVSVGWIYSKLGTPRIKAIMDECRAQQRYTHIVKTIKS